MVSPLPLTFPSPFNISPHPSYTLLILFHHTVLLNDLTYPQTTSSQGASTYTNNPTLPVNSTHHQFHLNVINKQGKDVTLYSCSLISISGAGRP